MGPNISVRYASFVVVGTEKVAMREGERIFCIYMYISSTLKLLRYKVKITYLK